MMCLVVIGLLGVAVHGVVRAAASGELAQNSLVGVRTPRRWLPAPVWGPHRAARPVSRVTAVAVPLAAVLGSP